MKLLLKISWRNIQRHKGKSLVIGIILFLGALIMTVGNGVISGMDKGLSENIMNRFTGQIVLLSKNQVDDNAIFIPMGKGLELIPEYAGVKKILDSQDYISKYIPGCRGFSLVLNEDGDMGFALLLGVDFPEYQKMFNNNVILEDGAFLKKGERGILITEGRQKSMFDEQDFWVKPKGFPLKESALSKEAMKQRKNLVIRDDIVLLGSNPDGYSLDVRIDVKGIIKYAFLNDYWKFFNIVDIESYREAFNYVTGTDAEVVLPREKKKIMESENLDDMFGSDLVVKTESQQEHYNTAMLVKKDKLKKKPAVDSGAYNVVFIKLKDISRIDSTVKKLNDTFKLANAGARAVSWKKATGQLGDMATIIRGALYVFVILIFFVAIIIIMNTLSMAAMERASEIGMMRAVGSQKSFIGRMFFIETSILSGIFGGAGIIIGIIAVAVLNSMNISTTNEILELLYGGNTFRPFIDMSDVIFGIIQLGFVTVISTIYPIRVARRITPLDAIARD
jgi:ABC-type lipoprotein release transport system permease subunit